MTLGERIKQLRKENGMTQVALAQKLNVTKGTVSTWETNSRVPSFDTLNELCDLFDKRLDYLMGRSDDASSLSTEDISGQLGVWETEDEYSDIIQQYAKIDDYGKKLIAQMLHMELQRSREQGTAYVIEDRIRVVIKKGNGDTEH